MKIIKPIRDSDSDASALAEEDDDAAGWGDSKKDYYNADVIETEADALEEEAEARRLQQKQLEGMTEADFGLDEIDWANASKDDEEAGTAPAGVVREVLPRLEITDSMGPEERQEILRTRYPEFEPLAKELLDLQRVHEELNAAIQKTREAQPYSKPSLADDKDTMPSMVTVKHSALSAYLAALCMYFALFTSGAQDANGKITAMPPDKLRDHAIMETLVQCRLLWEKVKDVETQDLVAAISDANSFQGTNEPRLNNKHLEEPIDSEKPPKKYKKRKNKAQKAAKAAQAEAIAHREERLRETEADLTSLSALTASSKAIRPSKPATTPAAAESDSDFGEATALTPHEAAEKAKRKKSLRFYTSQIAQKSNKRGAAGRDAGGDADLPYRERFKDRDARLNAEAEKRGKKPHDELEALGGESDEEDRAAANKMQEAEGEGDGSEDYYDLVSSRAAQKKASKAALAAAHAQAVKEGGIVRIVEAEQADGKRAISYAIEKNKGLTPKRSSLVRNPRVKKRKSKSFLSICPLVSQICRILKYNSRATRSLSNLPVTALFLISTALCSWSKMLILV